ncbi:hypothetical protein N7478_010348 [Penicillium angulare]|uniref:uncharacterized protein n=1 Tax=Penicillium angulare TaxID=116970 RepID=UPI0025409D87|nr:uncharacterized protein N7478_010348 [Penicillium angulare]KAJ5267540.1 hypothetical protein N7478_010348 [Penicillium angulare]
MPSDAFLLYALEFTYAAAIHEAMANALFPQVDHGQSLSRQAHTILDVMISNGNRIAEARKDLSAPRVLEYCFYLPLGLCRY